MSELEIWVSAMVLLEGFTLCYAMVLVGECRSLKAEVERKQRALVVMRSRCDMLARSGGGPDQQGLLGDPSRGLYGGGFNGNP